MGYNPLTGKDVTMPKTPTPKKSLGWDSPSNKKEEDSPSLQTKEGTSKRVVLSDDTEEATCEVFFRVRDG